MSEKQFEPCSLEEATHVEMGGKVYEFDIRSNDGQVLKCNVCIEVYMETGGWQRIQAHAFPILGIKPMREKKREPIEFETTFAMYLGNWIPLYSMHDGFLYEDNKKVKFKCVEILEDEK